MVFSVAWISMSCLGGHGPEAGAAISQYSDTYMMLFWVGLAFGIAYLVVAPLINKLMHGVK